jgi:3-methyl-2-oxobutanoate hydroxymethyltransferase
MSEQRKVAPSALLRKKRDGQKITMLTAYNFPMARFINEAGVDIVLVSDAVGTVGLDRPEAVSVSVEEMIYHTQAVRNGAGASMIVTTLPLGCYETVEQAVQNAVCLTYGSHSMGHYSGTQRILCSTSRHEP